jgi:hypothetical protein
MAKNSKTILNPGKQMNDLRPNWHYINRGKYSPINNQSIHSKLKMFSTKMFVCILAVGIITHQVLSQDLGGLLGGLLGGGGGGLSGLTNVLNGLLGPVLGGVTGGGNILNQLTNLITSLLNQITGGGQGCGILAKLLGGCGGGQPCCGCCNRTDTGVNDVCVTVGLLDFLVGTAECPTGSIVACTAQACKVGDTCNGLNLANLACLNVGK